MKNKYPLIGMIALSLFSTKAYSFSCSPCQQSTANSCSDSSGCLCGICHDSNGNQQPYYYCTDVGDGGSGTTAVWNYDLNSGTCGSMYQQPSDQYVVCQGTCYYNLKSKNTREKIQPPTQKKQKNRLQTNTQ